MPWWDVYEADELRRRERIRANGGVIGPDGAAIYPTKADPPAPSPPPRPSPPAPIMPPEPVTPPVPGLLGWIVALIVKR
ncbi:hypothetical protein [Nocardia rhizosphaerae]|uniref:Uncharacterized protein n=1 Tax=Nocardia rhizosphaerae TaxID=1691571 RepID=A0ABV8L2W5_9NOCA